MRYEAAVAAAEGREERWIDQITQEKHISTVVIANILSLLKLHTSSSVEHPASMQYYTTFRVWLYVYDSGGV